MSQPSKILRLAEDNILLFWCPGCHHAHQIKYGAITSWHWNNDVDKPTITPSILVTSGHYIPGHQGDCWCKFNQEHPNDSNYICSLCHSFITDGNIQFLGDCTHQLAGQTVPLSEWPDNYDS